MDGRGGWLFLQQNLKQLSCSSVNNYDTTTTSTATRETQNATQLLPSPPSAHRTTTNQAPRTAVPTPKRSSNLWPRRKRVQSLVTSRAAPAAASSGLCACWGAGPSQSKTRFGDLWMCWGRRGRRLRRLPKRRRFWWRKERRLSKVGSSMGRVLGRWSHSSVGPCLCACSLDLCLLFGSRLQVVERRCRSCYDEHLQN